MEASILWGELKEILKDVPDDYEIIVVPDENSIGLVKSVQIKNEWKEVRITI